MKSKNYMDVKLSRMNKSNKLTMRAFTMIELIVVIAVIAILVLLAMPKFANYTQKARAAQIVNDIKVLENRIDEYLIRHENFPDTFTAGNTGGGNLFDRTGPIITAPTNLKVVVETFIPESNLDGNFFVDEGGRVIYEDNSTVAGGGGGAPEVDIPAPSEAIALTPIGSGTEIDPYQLWYIEHIDYIRTDAASLSAHYKMMRSLDYNNAAHYIDSATNLPIFTSGEGWTPIGVNTRYVKIPFIGVFDGQDNKLDNLYINRITGFNQGLFGAIHGATVKNLNIENVNISLSGTGGALVAFMNTGSIVENVHASGIINDNDGWTGGLIGYAYISTISNSSADVALSGDNNMGGLVGYLEDSSLSNSHATGNVLVTSEYAGGLVGYIDASTVNESFAEGTVEGPQSIGGFAGTADGSEITNSYATGNVSGRDWIGGFAGYSDSIITSSYASGLVTASYKVAGGFVGDTSYGTITDSYATGNVVATGDSGWGDGYSIGGFAGLIYSGSVSRSYASGNVSAPVSSLIGGFVGENDGSINEGYATGSVTGKNDVGGFAGKSYLGDTISNVYASGIVSGELRFGTLIGTNAGTVTNSLAVEYSELSNGNLPSGFTIDKWTVEAGSTPKLSWE